ncbi:GNAT family N-acetyltransferase [Alicyclobacillus sp. ALC3]|uniref:GNAT family N-acetyltransferase n=1 Tax=Alicyclobacillus sp. ALC3 TaxID=2796143 RepID=UPI002379C88F|nr:GNAT family protein [Alicyclobacillus sp. ALC3]WDL95564.1 GNAT family N-acetyltransferase [Alicyclobacillus sp. ALC3]
MNERASVTLKKLDPSTAFRLWEAGQQSTDWPFDRTGALWQTRQSELAAAEVLAWGCARAVAVNGELVGLCTLQAVDPAVQAEPSTIECGTWLLTAARGRGLNQEVKVALLDFAFSGHVLPIPEWCLFLLHPDNTRARASLLRMPLPWVEEDSRDALTTKYFRAILRRRAWETGQPAIAIAIDRAAYLRSSLHMPLTDRCP